MKFITFLCLCLLVVLRVNAAEDPWVVLLTDAIELTGAADHQTIIIPISLGTDVNFKEVTITYNQPVYIQLDKKFDQSYFSGLTLLPFKTDSAPAIRIEVDLTKLRQTGTYRIYILLSCKGQKTTPLTLSLIRPMAKLDIPQTIHIDMVGSDIVRQDPFFVRETANVDIKGLDLQSPLFSGINSDKLVTFNPIEYRVQGRHRLFVGYTLNKSAISDLPIGKTVKGTMDIYAPELGTTVSADFEITNKASTCWIFWLLLAGVVCGTFARQYLKFKQDINEKKLNAFDLLNKLEIETANIKDKLFKEDVKSLQKALDNKLTEPVYINRWSTYTKELNDLTVLTANSYAELRKNFDARARAVRDKIAALSFLFGDNRVTTVIKNRLKPAQNFYEKGTRALSELNITDAEHSMRSAISAVNDFLTDYSQAVTRILSDDGTHLAPAGLPQPVKDEFKQQCLLILTLVQKLNAGPGDADGLIGGVKVADTIQLRLQEIAEFLFKTTELTFKAVWKNDGSELMKALKSSMEAWANYVGVLLQNPKQLINPEYLTDLNGNWNKVIKAKGKEQHILGDTDQTNVRTGPISAVLPLLGSQMVLGKFASMDISSQEILLQRTARDVRISWFATTLMQSLIILILMELTAYLFYAPNFNGTIQDKISLFVFAFGLNISMESLNLIRDRKSGAIG